MAGFGPEMHGMPQQMQQPGQGDNQQMQQMAAMMSMAAMAGMGHNGGMLSDAGTGVLAQQPFSGMPPAPALGGMDPSMAQAYAQMLGYLQQAQMTAPAPFPVAPPLPSYSAPAVLVPAISVCVDNVQFQYQLTEDDLLKVFARYGSVREIRVDEGGTMAQITFDDVSYAQCAMNDLNGKVLNGLEGTLRINWTHPPVHQQQQQHAQAPPYPMMPPFPGCWGVPGMPAWPQAPATGLGMVGQVGNFAPSSPQPPGTPPRSSAHSHLITPDGKAPAHVKGVRKYTCRFLIGIEGDKDFQVVRRIIGAKGSNMKKIVKQSEAKLRLRGIGSGYFEGSGQKESNEPLQLCVSCTSSDGYKKAVTLVEELLESVYVEYRAFCAEMGKPEPDLHATPQLVSSGRERGGGGGIDLFSPEDGSPDGELGMGDDEDDDDLSPVKREGGRKRGRRSRGGRKNGDPSSPEKGEPPRNAPDVEEIHNMIDQRNEARRQCNFSEADRLRQSLHERGVALMDEPGGRGKGTEVTTWRYWRE